MKSSVYLAVIIGAWTILFSSFSIFLHETYRSTALDLGLHAQLLWNLAHGRFMETSFLPYCFAGNHFWPALYFLVPFYQCTGINGMLTLQCLTVACGAIPAYLLSRDITGSEAWSRAFAVAYLAQPTLSMGVLFDFHFELFAVPFALLAVLAFRRGRPTAWIWAAAALSFYEVNAVVFACFGICLLLIRKRRMSGLALAALSLTYIAILCIWVMPHFRDSPHLPQWVRYVHLGATPWDILRTGVLHPFHSLAVSVSADETRTIWYLLLSFAALPIFSVKHLAPAAPLIITSLLSSFSTQMDIRFGYLAPVLPFLVLAAAHGAQIISCVRNPRFRWLIDRGPSFLIAISLSLSVYFQIRNPIRPQPFRLRDNLAAIEQAVSLVPSDASLSADPHLGAHFPNRSVLLLTPQYEYRGQTVEYVFADLRGSSFEDRTWWHQMAQLVKGRQYGPLFYSNDVVVLRTGITNPTLSEAVLARMQQQLLIAEKRDMKDH